MTSHWFPGTIWHLIPYWLDYGPTARQCVLYLGNKDPIREGRGVRAGLGLTVQINHQAGTDHRTGLFWGGLFSTVCWSQSLVSKVFRCGVVRGLLCVKVHEDLMRWTRLFLKLEDVAGEKSPRTKRTSWGLCMSHPGRTCWVLTVRL